MTEEMRLPATLDMMPEHYRDPVMMASAAFLSRYKTSTRRAYAMGLKTYINWCRINGLDPLAAQRPHIELFCRWMEEKGYERTTRAKWQSTVCLFYKYARIDRYVDEDPTIEV